MFENVPTRNMPEKRMCESYEAIGFVVGEIKEQEIIQKKRKIILYVNI